MRNRLLRMALAALLGLTLALMPLNVAAAARLSLTINAVDPSGFPWVVAYVTVVDDKGYPVTGLNAGSFEAVEDGVGASSLEVTSMVNSQERLAVAVMVDVSGSMDAQAMEDAKSAAATFINGLGEQDHASVMAFSTQVREVQGFTNDKGALLQAVNGLAPGGNTALYDALFAAVDAAAKSPIARKIVVLETDGYDTSSAAALEDGMNLARQKGVPVYTIGLGKELDRKVLSRIADNTGGTALFAPTSGDLQQAYRTITDQLRNQYVVKYLSPAPKGAKSYKLAVRVSQLLGKASAETTFAVTSAPPIITAFSLAEGAVLTEPTTVAVDVQSKRPVAEVRLEVNGQRVAQASSAPYSFTLQPKELASGRQQVTVTAIDSAGSSATKRVSVTVPAGVGANNAPTPPPQPDAQRSLNLPNLDLGTKIGGMAHAIIAKPQAWIQAIGNKIQAMTQAVVDGVNGAVDAVGRFFTEGIPGFLAYHQRTLLLIVATLSASSVAVFESRKLLAMVRQRLQWVTCHDCGSRYRAYEESCARCLMEQMVAQQESRSLGELLVENNLLAAEDLQAVMAESVATRKPLDVVLMERGKVSPAQLSQARFYLGRSAEMAQRRQELLADSTRGRMWNTSLFAPRLAVMLLALVVGSASSVFMV